MKRLFTLFLAVGIFQPLCADSYLDRLDSIIDQKLEILKKSSMYKVDKIVKSIRKNIKNEVPLQEINNFLDSSKSIAFFFCDETQIRLHVAIENESEDLEQAFTDLQFALGIKLYSYYLACAKRNMLHRAVENYDALAYWQNEQFYELQSLYQKNISRSLLGSGYKQKIDHNIKQLQAISKQTDSFLGLVLHNQELLHRASTQQELKANFKQAVRLQNDILQVSEQEIHDDAMSSIIKSSIDQLSQLSLYISAQHAQSQLPSHILRHWKGYTFTTAIACACAFAYLRYGTDIVQGLQYFWHEHVQGALERNRKTLSGVLEGPQFDLEANKKNAEALMDQLLQKPAPRTEGSPLWCFWKDLNNCTDGIPQQLYDENKDIVPVNPVTWKGRMFIQSIGKTTDDIITAASLSLSSSSQPQSKICNEISKLSFEEKKSLVLPIICTIKKHKDLNTFACLDAVDLELELKTVEGQQAINSVLKDVHMALGMVALVPLIALAGGSLFASKSLYNSVAYQPIRTIVRRLEVFLNEIFYESVSFDKEGHIYFLTEQLKLHVNVLTIPEQKLITADIAALQAPSLDYVQKTNVIQRMYRTYPCLIPARV